MISFRCLRKIRKNILCALANFISHLKMPTVTHVDSLLFVKFTLALDQKITLCFLVMAVNILVLSLKIFSDN